MNYSDRLKCTMTGLSAAVITMGAAVTGSRPFSPALPIGATRIPVTVEAPSGEWENGLYTLTDAATLTRTLITSSSNDGAAVTFPSGSKTVSCSILSYFLANGVTNPDDVGFDIILCAGQSNMAGSATSDPLIDVGDPGRVFQWANSSADTASYRKIITGVDPLYMPNGIRTGLTGPATWAAKAYMGTVPANRKVLLISCAVGSTGLVGAFWEAGSPGGQYYERAIQESNLAIAAALLLYPNSRFVGTLWAQGEADSLNGTTQAQYATGLKAVIAGFRTRITGAAGSWFIMSGMTPEGIAAQAGAIPINAAHIQVAAETDKCVFLPGFSGYASGVHYTGPGVRIMGSKMGLATVAARHSVGSDVTAPVVSTAAVANAQPSKVVLTHSEALNESFTPAITAYTVSGHTVSSVLVSGARVTLTVDAFVNGEAARTVAYTQPGSNQLRDVTGNLLATFTGQAITNNVAAVDTTPPIFSSAQVANATPTVIQITMNEACNNSFAPAISAFSASGGKSVTAVSVAGALVSVTVNAGYVLGDVITVQYTDPGTGNRLQDAAGNFVASFGPSAVTNNVGAAASAPDAPTSVVATAGNASASVAFTAGATNGSATTGFTVTSSPGALTGTGASSPINVAGLTNGTAYTLTVTQTNGVGTSVPSAASNSVTPAAGVTYATLNPADTAAGVTLSNGNLTAAGTAGYKSSRTATGKSVGKWYWEVKMTVGTSSGVGIGLVDALNTTFPGASVKGWGYLTSGSRYWANAVAETIAAFTTNDVIGIALDMDAKICQFYKNGVATGTTFGLYQATGGTVPLAAGTAVYPMIAPNSSTLVANFGALAFAFAPPAGFTGLTA